LFSDIKFRQYKSMSTKYVSMQPEALLGTPKNYAMSMHIVKSNCTV